MRRGLDGNEGRRDTHVSLVVLRKSPIHHTSRQHKNSSFICFQGLEQRTGLKATSLAAVAGTAYVSGREPGAGVRFLYASGRPDEIPGLMVKVSPGRRGQGMLVAEESWTCTHGLWTRI